MKQLTCEMCGSTELIKQDGFFVCQTCGCKYSVEEEKKMMIEGTVDVQGTVRIDKSKELKNLLELANRAYDDNNVKDAENLYKQILSIDPNNHTAIFFQGMSIGWQASLSDYEKFSQAHKASLRALEVLKENVEKGETDVLALKMFSNEVYSEFVGLGTEISKACNKAYANAVDVYTNTTSRLMRSGVSDPGWYDEQFSKAKEKLNKEEEKYDKLRDNTFLLMLEVLEYIYNDCICIFDEEVDTIESEIDLLSAMEDTAKYEYTKNSLAKYKNFLKEAIVEIKRKVIEKYWSKHAEEKAQLDEEKEELEKIKEKTTTQIAELQKSKEKVPSLELLVKKQKEIESLEVQKKALGLFKFKEKKVLQEQIDSLVVEKGKIKTKVTAEQQEIEKQITPIRAELNKAIARIKEIDNELTMDRDEEEDDDE